MLLCIILDPVLRATFKAVGLESMVAGYLDVLCWVLHHDHNETFAKNVADIETGMAAAGYVLEDLEDGDEEKERTQ
jgi:hypothetical protein